MVARRLQSFGVDVSQVRWQDGGRMGLYFIEPGAAPRSSTVLYDRANSAASEMKPGDFEWSVLDDCGHVHLTGITPALSGSAAATTARAIAEAKARGKKISFDVNFRGRLWSPQAAKERLLGLIRHVDLLICPMADALTVFGIEGRPEHVAEQLGELSEARNIALTLGAGGAVLWDRKTFHRAEPFPVHAIDRVGAGDAFDAGLIWGYLRGDAPKGLVYGMAMAAIKHTIPGDEWISSLAEVEALIESGHRDIQR
jgi:2-dehydro-3-deoxygluconokinase